MTSTSRDGDTPGTTPDPETGAEGDSDQLTQEDSLLDRGVDDLLDEGYTVPDRPPGSRLETPVEQSLGESLDDRLAQEEPEVADRLETPEYTGTEPDRAGRLTAAEADPMGGPADTTEAVDVGLSGGAASAEEAAMHVIEEEVEPGP